MKRAKISGVGYYVPEKVVTNDDLTKVMNTTDEWIQERTGVKERHYADTSVDKNYVMAAKAARKALEQAGKTPQDVDLIIYATLSPDYVFPGSGVLLQRELGCKHVGAIDVRAQCSGFIYSLQVAEQFIATGKHETILVVGSEVHSTGFDFSDHGRHVSVIFGDGAGAVIIQPSEDENKGILTTHIHSEGQYAEELAILAPSFSETPRYTPEIFEPGGSAYPVMNGQFVFKNAIVRMSEAIDEALDATGCSIDDIDLLIPHQANARITQMVQKKYKLPDNKVVSNIHKYGNTTAASIIIGLAEALEDERVKPGDLVCLVAFGSGFTWASALMRW